MVATMTNPGILACCLQSFSHLPIASSILVHQERFLLQRIFPLLKFILDNFEQHGVHLKKIGLASLSSDLQKTRTKIGVATFALLISDSRQPEGWTQLGG